MVISIYITIRAEESALATFSAFICKCINKCVRFMLFLGVKRSCWTGFAVKPFLYKRPDVKRLNPLTPKSY